MFAILHYSPTGRMPEEIFNLGERKNNRKRKEKESRGEEKRERHDGSPHFKSAFSLFCGLSKKGFPEISP